jgi:hypothetical protein
MVFIEPDHTIIIYKCYDFSKFSCFPLYLICMSGCRLLISIRMNEILKYHYRRQGYIYASGNVIKNKRLFGSIYFFYKLQCSNIMQYFNNEYRNKFIRCVFGPPQSKKACVQL